MCVFLGAPAAKNACAAPMSPQRSRPTTDARRCATRHPAIDRDSGRATERSSHAGIARFQPGSRDGPKPTGAPCSGSLLHMPGLHSCPPGTASASPLTYSGRDREAMTYHVEGRLLEVCNCAILCPCWVGEDPDPGTCDSVLAWAIDCRNGRGNRCQRAGDRPVRSPSRQRTGWQLARRHLYR